MPRKISSAKRKPAPFNSKLAQPSPHGGFRLRVRVRKPKPNHLAVATIRCGCCDQAVAVEFSQDVIEINGVAAHRKEWLKVLQELSRLSTKRTSK